ncbi:hypothetical protein ZIOFF_021336 [Zingiber officinale]|uniref:Uncharacterized protein n=1 Tax=Zingiber officinale TaxID=94328 RepID=A0A8J5L8I4_ZINOF|nr:hypothetical protein ZIOFF_021336 [Zingiber officinale]
MSSLSRGHQKLVGNQAPPASTVHRRSTVSAILLQLSGQHCSPAIHSVSHLVTTVSSSDMSYQQLTWNWVFLLG